MSDAPKKDGAAPVADYGQAFDQITASNAAAVSILETHKYVMEVRLAKRAALRAARAKARAMGDAAEVVRLTKEMSDVWEEICGDYENNRELAALEDA